MPVRDQIFFGGKLCLTKKSKRRSIRSEEPIISSILNGVNGCIELVKNRLQSLRHKFRSLLVKDRIRRSLDIQRIKIKKRIFGAGMLEDPYIIRKGRSLSAGCILVREKSTSGCKAYLEMLSTVQVIADSKKDLMVS